MAAIDIDMSEFTQKTTLASTDFITGTLADGSAVKIKVSDLASVVAGVIEYGTTKIQNLADNTNLDSVFYNARFYINSDYTGDNPPYSPMEWCVVETIRFGSSYVLQIVRKWWNPNQGKIRCYQNSSWGTWYDL